jgi:xanthosine utilization system XapX-like protein
MRVRQRNVSIQTILVIPGEEYMVQTTMAGVIAGATGTVALDVATYLDMAIRGRSSSSAPSQLIDVTAKSMHIPLSPQGVGAQDQLAHNRESGLGALLGYINGLGVGFIYSLIRSRLQKNSLPLAAIGVGLAAMAASDVPLFVARISNPKSWGLSGWASDFIPHLIYGLVTVTTYEALIAEEED